MEINCYFYAENRCNTELKIKFLSSSCFPCDFQVSQESLPVGNVPPTFPSQHVGGPEAEGHDFPDLILILLGEGAIP